MQFIGVKKRKSDSENENNDSDDTPNDIENPE